jgi:hypothetical protein
MPRLSLSLNMTTSLQSTLFNNPYIIDFFAPALVFDFEREYYSTGYTRTTFDAAMTHTRSGNATMVDSDGVLKWAPHNLLLRSEEFDNAAWVKTNATVTANAAVSPDGTTTADSLNESGTTQHYIHQEASLLSGFITFSVFVKQRAGSRYLQLRPLGLGGDVAFANFNPVTGEVVSGGTGGAAFVSASVVDAGNGWYRCTLVGNYPTAPSGMLIALSNGVGELPNYIGDGSGFYIYGAHLYRSDLGGMVTSRQMLGLSPPRQHTSPPPLLLDTSPAVVTTSTMVLSG